MALSLFGGGGAAAPPFAAAAAQVVCVKFCNLVFMIDTR
jgi:hypothetical protein